MYIHMQVYVCVFRDSAQLAFAAAFDELGFWRWASRISSYRFVGWDTDLVVHWSCDMCAPSKFQVHMRLD